MLLFIPTLMTGRQGKPDVFTRALTIDHLQVPSTQTDFPVLVNFTDSTFKTVANGGHVTATNAFTFSSDSAGVSLLKWEVERYNATTGEIVAWVKIASVSSVSDTVFYLRYGALVTTDQSDAVNVWTNSFLAVYHLKDGTTLSVVDSVGSFNGTNHSATATVGQIDGGGAYLSSGPQYTSTGNIKAAAMTASCWAKGTTFPTAYNAPWSSDNGAVNQYFSLRVKSNGKLACYLWATGDVSYDGTGSTTLSTNTFYHLAMSYNNVAGLVGYVNATSDGTAAANGNITTSSTAFTSIGANDPNGVITMYWNGVIDEVRIASVARSANWITCEYNNQKTGTTFVALGAES